MGIGHLAVGFAAKRAVPRLPLGLLLLAVTFVDILWGAAILLGVEHARLEPGATAAMPFDLYDYPYTHSLLAGVLWALLFGGAFFVLRHYRAGAVMLGALVLSHWVLDVVSHRPDMPVLLNGPYLGLGLWNSKAASVIVEEAMFAGGLWLYLRATTPRGPQWGLAMLTGVIALLGVAGYTSPPPPSVTPLAVGNLASCVFLVLAQLVDRTRVAAA